MQRGRECTRERSIETGRRVEKKESKAEQLRKLSGLLRGASLEMNKRLKEYAPEGKDIVGEDCCIRMQALQKKEGGPYSEIEIEKDKEFIKERELEWSGAGDENVQEFYREQFIGRYGKAKFNKAYGNTSAENMVR